MLKSLGGDRLGSGNKMKVALHNYERSTHDLSFIWRSTMAPGTLVPFMKVLGLKSDTFTIDTKALIRTMPAIGPLFGSYKLQLDFFECPLRLYNGILHNNMTKIGLDMTQVKLPKILLTGYAYDNSVLNRPLHYEENSPSSLLRYLGITGIGGVKFSLASEMAFTAIQRKFNAVPILAYYDIFKNYYANKQEEMAYVVANEIIETLPKTDEIKVKMEYGEHPWAKLEDFNKSFWNDSLSGNNLMNTIYFRYDWGDGTQQTTGIPMEAVKNTEKTYKYFLWDLKLKYNTLFTKSKYGDATFSMSPILNCVITSDNEHEGDTPVDIKLDDSAENTLYNVEYTEDNEIILTVKNKDAFEQLINDTITNPSEDTTYTLYINGISLEAMTDLKNKIKLQPFKLENIDAMRVWLLQNTQLGTENLINDIDMEPYKTVYTLLQNHFPMNGLVVKTYQSDMFNNWLSNEWIDGVKGINSITSVAVENDAFTIDALNLANKVYNMLNRIAVSGGSYEDWLEAVYGDDAIRRAESPIYCGGASGTIAFEEVVSTADTNTATAGDQPLGTVAGKGTMVNYSGGEIDIKLTEPGYIIAIASITPLIDYCQGNEFDMTDLDSVNDIHKPALDGIGFQDLMLEQAAYWATYINADDEEVEKPLYRNSGGKLPAWINYMTNWNKVYGEFAEKDKLGWMVLRRDYERGEAFYGGSMPGTNSQGSEQRIPIKDWTTYINPTKFNYQFANKDLDAQNFWVQIGVNITARRKMSAKIIPNL